MKELLNSTKRTVKYWWVSLLIGILAITLGVVFISSPVGGLVTLSMLFIAGFLASGTMEIIFAISNRKTLSGWGWTLTSGIIDLALGILLFAVPTITPIILVYFVGFWIMFRSVWAIGSSMELQRIGVSGWGWLLALAILGLIMSFVFIFIPIVGGTMIVAFAAIALIVYGIFRIYFAFRLKSIKEFIEKN